MRTIEIKVYKFDELSSEAQQKALDKLWDIDVKYCDWYDFTYEDAERIGLKITGFELDYWANIEGHIIESSYRTANAILKEHGKDCETFKLAETFIAEWDKAVSSHSDGINIEKVCEEKEDDFDLLANDLEEQFLKDLLKEYHTMLKDEYEYRTSKEAIIETIEANEYEFYEDGNLIEVKHYENK